MSVLELGGSVGKACLASNHEDLSSIPTTLAYLGMVLCAFNSGAGEADLARPISWIHEPYQETLYQNKNKDKQSRWIAHEE